MSSEAHDKTGISRRDFLGLASLGAVILSSLAVLAGIFRMSKPNVRYEESTRFKIGKPENFPVGTVKKLDDKGVFIFANDDGLHAISSVCTHLGCIVNIAEWGFQCPCHGSKYNENGKVIGGPAPRSLAWLEISRNVDGSLEVDTAKEVPIGTKFKLNA
ncbi:MAG: Rieske 2Fe-2S domain-containing protein [Nitrospiraceae bacterium]|nr:Rieske 2Fe-2S domain-containing protein [Nitrospirota bacterium]MDA8339859.1 Rieske 2Fe-2S domain-containing protein [Nitrospiraceae bacterium]